MIVRACTEISAAVFCEAEETFTTESVNVILTPLLML